MKIYNIYEKIETTKELWLGTNSIYEKINLIKCVLYNLKLDFLKEKEVNFLPISATIYVNTICNYRCSFCFLINEDHTGSKSMNLDINDFKKIINNKFLRYAPRITLGGGEPYLNKNIFSFIKILKEKSKIISIYTNGSLIERNYINFFLYQPNYLNISHYDDKFDSLKSVFKKINNHKDKKFISRLSKIIQSNKLDDMEKIILISIQNNFDRVIFQNYFPYKKKEKELVLYNDNIEFKNLKKLLSKKYKNKIKIVWPNLLEREEVFRCNNISINTTVDANGNIAPCCFLTPPEKKHGNIFLQDTDTWNSNSMMSFRSFLGGKKSPKECENCYFKVGLRNRSF